MFYQADMMAKNGKQMKKIPNIEYLIFQKLENKLPSSKLEKHTHRQRLQP